jgi:hypothetical protein
MARRSWRSTNGQIFTAILFVVADVKIRIVGQRLPAVRDLFAASESASLIGSPFRFPVAAGLLEEAVKAGPTAVPLGG